MCLRLFNDPAMYLIHFCFSLLSSFLLPSRFGIIGEFFLFAWLFARPTSFIQLGFALCTVHTHMERHKQTRIAAGEERTNSSHMCLLQFSEDATICFLLLLLHSERDAPAASVFQQFEHVYRVGRAEQALICRRCVVSCLTSFVSVCVSCIVCPQFVRWSKNE